MEEANHRMSFSLAVSASCWGVSFLSQHLLSVGHSFARCLLFLSSQISIRRCFLLHSPCSSCLYNSLSPSRVPGFGGAHRALSLYSRVGLCCLFSVSYSVCLSRPFLRCLLSSLYLSIGLIADVAYPVNANGDLRGDHLLL